MPNERSTKSESPREVVVQAPRVVRAPAPTSAEQKADTVAANLAADAAKARKLDSDTKRGVKQEPGAGNSRTGVDGLPIR